MTTIAFVCSHREELEPVRLLLVEQKCKVEIYGDIHFAMNAIKRRMPDVLVIVSPPALNDNVTTINRIRSTSIVPIIMLSDARDEIDEIMSLRLGADDYICKPVSPRLVVERINAQLRRHEMLEAYSRTESTESENVTCGELVIDRERYDVQLKGQQVALTSREFELLMALVRRPGRVKTRDQLMSAAYAEDIYVDDRTIDSHIKRIRSKLRAVDPGFAGIETLYGIGYRFVAPKEVPAVTHDAYPVQARVGG